MLAIQITMKTNENNKTKKSKKEKIIIPPKTNLKKLENKQKSKKVSFLRATFLRQTSGEKGCANVINKGKKLASLEYKLHHGLTKQEIALNREVAKIAEQQSPDADWVNLDNAAMIFPATDSVDINGMFRLSAILAQKIDPLILQQALNGVVKRFPTIACSIKKGFFWYYLEPSNFPITVEKETLFPCTRIPMDSRHACIRVTYYNCRISVDFFHAVTDGNGGIVFLNSLVGAYLRLLGEKITPQGNYLDDRDKPRREESVDSFMQMADLKTPKTHKDVVSYKIEGERLLNYSLMVVNGSMDSQQLKEKAKSYGATVGQYLVATLCYAIEKDREFYGYDKKHPVVISVPANLRKMYPSPTVRNFISVMCVHSTGNTDFEQIIQKIKSEFDKQNKKEFFMGVINFNVKSQKNFLIKICPLFLKNIVLKIVYDKLGAKARTSTLSNLGQIKAPPEFDGKVLRYEFVLGPQTREMVSLSCCSFNGRTVVSASRTIKEQSVVKLFFQKLAEDGLDVVIDANHEV